MERWWWCISCAHTAWRGTIYCIVYLHAKQSEGKNGADLRELHLAMGGGADNGKRALNNERQHGAWRLAVARHKAVSSWQQRRRTVASGGAALDAGGTQLLRGCELWKAWAIVGPDYQGVSA